MKKSLYLGASMLAIAAAAIVPASAADMYRGEPGGYKDGPAYVPANAWTGFYIGANGGYGWSAGNAKVSAAASTPVESAMLSNSAAKNFDSNGGFGGGQIGYNWQHGQLVLGVEADLQGAGINGNGTEVTNAGRVITTASARSSLDWFGTVRGRLGYAFDHTLVYATGGLAFGGVNDRLSLTVDDTGNGGRVLSDSAKKDTTRTGFALGGGIEYALTPAWSLKGEYQYIDLGSSDLTATATNPNTGNSGTGSVTVDHTYHTARVGLNYHVGQGYEPLK